MQTSSPKIKHISLNKLMKTTLIVISSIIVCQVLFPTSTLASIQIRANERSLTNRSELAQNTNSAQSYLEIGINKHDARDFQGAIVHYDQAIKINRNYTDAYYHRGLAKSALRQEKAAISDYTQAIEINRNHFRAYTDRGVSKYQLGSAPDAIVDYDRAIAINPNYADAYFNRAGARVSLGDLPGATSDYTETIRIKPNDAQAYLNRSIITRKSNSKGSQADLEKAFQLNPNILK
jgi:tetratricopeptide (TPR) repeat protein